MTKEERKTRFKVAIEIVDKIFTDMCHDRDVPKEDVEDLRYLLVDMIKHGAKIGVYPTEEELNGK